MADSMISCHVCIHRNKTLPAVETCKDCDMVFCSDCAFTHYYVCPSHETVDRPGRSRDGTSVDLSTDVERKDDDPHFELYKQFSTDEDDDEVEPILRHALWTEKDYILITDTGNCMLKVFDKEGNYCGGHFVGHAEEDAAGRMHGIAQTETNEFYVTMPSQKKLAAMRMFEQSDGKVKFRPVFHDTERRYFGIANLIQAKKLIVGTTDTVDIIDYTGHHVKSIYKMIFQNPYNMTVENSTSVLVSDTLANAVMRVNANGKIESLTNFGKDAYAFRLRGLTTDSQGNILVCALRRHGLERLSRSGARLGSVLQGEKGLEKAIGIDFKKTSSGTWLVVALEDGRVKVFKVSYV